MRLKIRFFLESFLGKYDDSAEVDEDGKKKKLVDLALEAYPDLVMRDQNGGKFQFDKSQSYQKCNVFPNFNFLLPFAQQSCGHFE